MFQYNILFSSGYAFDLMVSLKEQYANSPSALRAFSEGLAAAAPAPVAKTFQQVEKDQAVAQYLTHKSRFSCSNPNPPWVLAQLCVGWLDVPLCVGQSLIFKTFQATHILRPCPT